MREDASEFKMLALGELASEAIRICGLYAQAIHAGIDLQMNRGAFLAEFGGGGFVGEKLLATMNSWSEIVLDEGFFFAVPETPSTRMGVRTPTLRISMPSPEEATPNQSEP